MMAESCRRDRDRTESAKIDVMSELSTRYEFPRMLYDMLEAVTKDKQEHIVSWMPHGRAFKVHNPQAFEEQIMPMYFTEKYDSFRYLLGQWGFLRISRGRDRGAYFHVHFIRGQRKMIVKATKDFMVQAMPEFLPASDEPDLYKFAEDVAAKQPSRNNRGKAKSPAKEAKTDKRSSQSAKKPSDQKRKPQNTASRSRLSSDAQCVENASFASRDKKKKSKLSQGKKEELSASVIEPMKVIEQPKLADDNKRVGIQSRYSGKQQNERPKTRRDQFSLKQNAIERKRDSSNGLRSQKLSRIPLCRYYLPPLLFSPRIGNSASNPPQPEASIQVIEGSNEANC